MSNDPIALINTRLQPGVEALTRASRFNGFRVQETVETVKIFRASSHRAEARC